MEKEGNTGSGVNARGGEKYASVRSATA